LLLSVGLIPENELSVNAGVDISPVTNGAAVDQNRQTSIEGVFSCGNVLHVHDLVDYVSDEGEIAGKSAVKYIKGEINKGDCVTVKTDGKVRYTVPQKICAASENESVELYFRVANVYKNVRVVVLGKDGEVLLAKKKQALVPGGMEHISIKADMLKGTDEITVGLEEIL
jgi:pyruvate/2-oxoglutarate dehydrogenase complex dihydrolipoamide dehydrogenase (E3) component